MSINVENGAYRVVANYRNKNALSLSREMGCNDLYMDILLSLIDFGIDDGYIGKRFWLPDYPEILSQMESICGRIYLYLQKEFEKPEMKEQDFSLSEGYVCIAAGMGASNYGRQHNVNNVDLFEILTREEGIYYLDEVVFSKLRIGRTGANFEKYQGHMMKMVKLAMMFFDEEKEKDEAYCEMYMFQREKALFMYGIMMEMKYVGLTN